MTTANGKNSAKWATVLDRLVDKPSTVDELATSTGVSHQSVRRYLGVLHAVGRIKPAPAKRGNAWEWVP
jgi:response regulator of citrate/malate metabolism